MVDNVLEGRSKGFSKLKVPPRPKAPFLPPSSAVLCATSVALIDKLVNDDDPSYKSVVLAGL